MASVNKVILVGNLGRDPEVRAFPSGDRIATFSLATTDKWKDKTSGEAKESTEWHRVVFSGRIVDVIEQYTRKGSAVYVEGSLRTRKYQDKDGTDKYSTEIRGDRIQLLGGPREGGDRPSDRPSDAPREHPRAAAPAPTRGGGFDDLDDDIPF